MDYREHSPGSYYPMDPGVLKHYGVVIYYHRSNFRYLWRFPVNFPWKTRGFRDPAVVFYRRSVLLPRPFVHNSVCSQFLEGLFAILAECSQFCLRPPSNTNSRVNLHFAGWEGGKNCEQNFVNGRFLIFRVGSYQFRESLRRIVVLVLLKSWDAIPRMEFRILRMEFRIPRVAPRIPLNSLGAPRMAFSLRERFS